MKKLIAWLLSLFRAPKPTPSPLSPPLDEYIQRPGHVTEIPVNTYHGTFSADVFVPAAPPDTQPPTQERLTWERGNIVWLKDSAGNTYEIRGYKVKSCGGGICREPRYGLPWGVWRRIEATWTGNRFEVRIDGSAPLVVFAPGLWANEARLIYGDLDGHLLVGCRLRGVKVASEGWPK